MRVRSALWQKSGKTLSIAVTSIKCHNRGGQMEARPDFSQREWCVDETT